MFLLYFGVASNACCTFSCRTSFRVDSILAHVEAEHKKQLYRCSIVLFSSVSYYVVFVTQYTNCLVDSYELGLLCLHLYH